MSGQIDLLSSKRYFWKSIAIYWVKDFMKSHLPLINIWQMFNLDTDDLAVKPHIPHKSLLQWICCKCLVWWNMIKKINLHPQKNKWGCWETWPQTASMTSEVKINYAYVITQDICNKFIEVNFCVGCMVWWPNRLFQHWTSFDY